jgi:hypothetical protein
MLGATGFTTLLKAALSHYERWIDETTKSLRDLFADSELEMTPRSGRYWVIVTTDPSLQHLAAMIRAELNYQSDSFLDVANVLRALKERYKRLGGAGVAWFWIRTTCCITSVLTSCRGLGRMVRRPG